MDTSGIGALAFIAAFSAIGLVYIGYPLLCILLGVIATSKLRKKFSNQRFASVTGLALTIILLAIPFADFPSARDKFLERCEEDGGVAIFRTVQNVEGVHGLANATNYGYSYGEKFVNKSDHSAVHRYYKPLPDSQGMYRIEDGTTVSQYGFRTAMSVVDNDTTRVEAQTYVVKTGEVLGRHVSYLRSPDQNVPGNKGQRITINSFRPWLRMSCHVNGIGEQANYTRELLLRTLPPHQK